MFHVRHQWIYESIPTELRSVEILDGRRIEGPIQLRSCLKCGKAQQLFHFSHSPQEYGVPAWAIKRKHWYDGIPCCPLPKKDLVFACAGCRKHR